MRRHFTVFICDVCEREASEHTEPDEAGRFASISLGVPYARADGRWSSASEPKHYDVCNDCMLKLENWKDNMTPIPC